MTESGGTQMPGKIGETAGKVWHYLKENGAASATALSKALNVDTATVNQAIGWLAREEKINIDRGKRATKYSLR